MKIDLTQLALEEGPRTVPFAEALQSETEIPFLTDVVGEVRLARVGALVRLTGRATTVAGLTCDRCLRPVRYRLVATFEEAVRAGPEVPASGMRRALGAEDFVLTLPDGVLDLSALVREHLLLAVPMVVTCREACRGLCPVCGADRNTEPCACGETAPDPRLAPLRHLKV
jgi:uncharacterized protein